MADKGKSSKKSRQGVSVQQYMDIAEIKDDVIIMRDGTIRAVLLVSSINFALKSEEEQNAIVSSYVSFLNNISFPVQIVIQSRKMNIEDYVQRLQEKEKEQTNELLKVQTKEYIQYIQELVSLGDIMTKSFYICIPYNPISDSHKNFWQSLTESFKPVSLVKMKGKQFERYKTELERRIDNITSALSSASLNSVRLDTQGLVELFYNTYNPDTSDNEKITDIKDIKISNQ